MAVLMLGQIDIHDRETYAGYEAGFMPILQRFGGRIVGLDDAPALLEGEWPFSRVVLIEFDSEEDARAWFESDEYQALAEKRKQASNAAIMMFKRLG